MKEFRNVPAFGLAVLLMMGLAFAQQATGPTQQLDELRQQWAELYNQGDMATLAEQYTEDATLYDVTGAVAEGRQAIQENLQATFDQGAAEVEINAIETEVFGNAAYDLGSYTFSTADGQTVSRGNYMIILQRTNGDWQIHRQIANMVLPTAPEGSAGAGMTYQFTKEDPDGDNIWDGTLTGDTEGTVQTVLLNADQSQPVWRVAFEGIVTAGDESFRAHVGGTLDTTTGAVRMTGVVTAGSMLGSTVVWQGQMVDQEASRFEGTISVMPAGASGEGTSGN